MDGHYKRFEDEVFPLQESVFWTQNILKLLLKTVRQGTIIL